MGESLKRGLVMYEQVVALALLTLLVSAMIKMIGLIDAQFAVAVDTIRETDSRYQYQYCTRV